MQKKTVGILASVAAAHAVLAIALMTGGGCRQPVILSPHTYNNGPQVEGTENALPEAGQQGTQPELPVIDNGSAPVPPPAAVKPAPVAPIAPVDPVAPVAGGSRTYVVKKGDILSRIAYKHGVSTRALAACNNLTGKAANKIRIGQVLTIPEAGAYTAPVKSSGKKNAAKGKKATGKKNTKTAVATVALPADGIYVVKAGDSLDRIGRRFKVSARAIAKENNIALTKILQIGDKLRIPGKAAAKVADTTPAAKPAVDAAETTNNDLLNGLDPNSGLDTAAPAANAAPAESAPAAAEPAAPAAGANTRTDSLEVVADMTIDEFCKRNSVSKEEIRRLNPDMPADGNLKGGTYLNVPVVVD